MSNPYSKIVRFKMRVIDNDRSEPTVARIRMNGVYDTIPENEADKYIAGEPQGPIRFQIRNPEVSNLFVEGQDYYVDFTTTFQEVGSKDNPSDDVNVENYK